MAVCKSLEINQLKSLTKRCFTFLRRLRAGGRSNMYGAIPYLAAAFGVDREQAFRIVCEWLDAERAAGGQADSTLECTASAPKAEPRKVVRVKSSRRSAGRRKSSGRKAA